MVLPKILGSTLNFMRGLVNGTASIEDAGVIVFLLYFVVFLAIFMEGIKRVKIFTDGNKINKSGKVLAIATSLLSTIALFTFQKQNTLPGLVNPFGLWAAVILAGIVAFITFISIRDSGLFDQSFIIAISFAASVGLTFASMILSWDTLLGWGFFAITLIMIIGIIWHSIEHYSATPEEKENKRQESIQIAEKTNLEREKRLKNEKRKKTLQHAESYLITIIKNAQNLEKLTSDEQRNSTIFNHVKIDLNTIHNNLINVINALKRKIHLNNNYEEKEYLVKLLEHSELQLKFFEERIVEPMKHENNNDSIYDNLFVRSKEIALRSGHLLDSIRKYIQTGEINL